VEFATGINDSGRPICHSTAGVVDTDGKFVPDVNDTAANLVFEPIIKKGSL
jgi:hypothetical protein